MAAKPKFMQKTPSERAGLVGVKTPADGMSDDELWKRLRESPVAKQIVADAEAARLAQRRELIERRHAEIATANALVEEISLRRQEAQERREKAEQTFREALLAES